MEDNTLLVIAGMALLGFFGFLAYLHMNKHDPSLPSTSPYFLNVERDEQGNILNINGYPTRR